MLSTMQGHQSYQANQCDTLKVCAPQGESRYSRNEKDDMKKAIELLYEFKRGLDELHPNCTTLMEQMLQYNRRNY